MLPLQSFSIDLNKDTIDFTDTNEILWLININNNQNVIIDTIKLTINNQYFNYFTNSFLYIDTIINNGSIFGRDYRYFLNLKDSTGIAFSRDSNQRIEINNNDSIQIRNIWIQDLLFGIPEYPGHTLSDTIKMIFIASDNSVDSIVARINMRYATNIIFKKNNKIIKNQYSDKNEYLLNGKLIQSKLKNKNIIIIKTP
jgi:hypothetical protein